MVVAGSAKFQKLLEAEYKTCTERLRAVLATVRRVTVCLDGWSKTNLSASFLGISVCFYDPVSAKVRHVVLQLAQIEHPHTAAILAEHLEQCLQEWNISSTKVLMIVSDNGANMVKAVKLLNDRHLEQVQGEYSQDGNSEAHDQDTDEDEGTSEEEDDDISEEADDATCNEQDDEIVTDVEVIDLADLQAVVPFRRLMCMAHSLQLVIRKAYNHYDSLITKARRIVGRVKKSSVATQKLKKTVGKVLLSDNSTRWNSTFRMAERLIHLKDAVNEVLMEQKCDTLLVSEWRRLEEMCELLKPFAVQTDKLQSNSQSLSYVLPALMELDFHLQCVNAPKAVTTAMLDDMQTRFQLVHDSTSDNFNPLPAASCLLDPTVAPVLLTDEAKPLLEAATDFIINEVLSWFNLHVRLLCSYQLH